MEQWIRDWKVETREIDAFGEPPKSEPDWHLHAGGVSSPVNDSEGGGQRSEVKVGERSEIDVSDQESGGGYCGRAEPVFDLLGVPFVECVIEFAQRMTDHDAETFFVCVQDAMLKVGAVQTEGGRKISLHAENGIAH